MKRDKMIEDALAEYADDEAQEHADSALRAAAEDAAEADEADEVSAGMLTFSTYAEAAGRTAVYPDRRREGAPAFGGVTPGLMYAVLGLMGEAGEVAEKIKKALRDDGGAITPERLQALELEIGDVLWYTAAALHELNIPMARAARSNLRKLADRAARDTLKGEGDDR